MGSYTIQHNKSNRGKVLEDMVEMTCNQYRAQGLANIHKVPTPIIRGKGYSYYQKKSTVDFTGCLKNGLFLAMECKTTKQTRFYIREIKEHQREYLQSIDELGGYACLLLYFSTQNRFFLVEVNSIDFSRSSLSIECLEEQAAGVAGVKELQLSPSRYVLDFIPD